VVRHRVLVSNFSRDVTAERMILSSIL